MTDLVKITQNEGASTVSARELHEVLEVQTQFTKWCERMFEYGFVENKDYIAISQKRLTAQNNETTFTDFALTLDTAKEIAMLQRSEKGRQVRLWFISREKELQALELGLVKELRAKVAQLTAEVALNLITEKRIDSLENAVMTLLSGEKGLAAIPKVKPQSRMYVPMLGSDASDLLNYVGYHGAVTNEVEIKDKYQNLLSFSSVMATDLSFRKLVKYLVQKKIGKDMYLFLENYFSKFVCLQLHKSEISETVIRITGESYHLHKRLKGSLGLFFLTKTDTFQLMIGKPFWYDTCYNVKLKSM